MRHGMRGKLSPVDAGQSAPTTCLIDQARAAVGSWYGNDEGHRHSSRGRRGSDSRPGRSWLGTERVRLRPACGAGGALIANASGAVDNAGRCIGAEEPFADLRGCRDERPETQGEGRLRQQERMPNGDPAEQCQRAAGRQRRHQDRAGRIVALEVFLYDETTDRMPDHYAVLGNALRRARRLERNHGRRARSGHSADRDREARPCEHRARGPRGARRNRPSTTVHANRRGRGGHRSRRASDGRLGPSPCRRKTPSGRRTLHHWFVHNVTLHEEWVTYTALPESPGASKTATSVKPASASMLSASSSPHPVPRPAPPSARETVMQCSKLIE
jgi:hypothetical protein